MKKQEAVSFTEKLLVPIAEENHYEIVDVEYEKEGANWYLRVYADKEGGFSINDCVTLSRALEKAIEVDDPFTDPYILEVSSPGLDRPLKKAKDFNRSIGKLCEVKLYKADADNGLEKEFNAFLRSYDDLTQVVGLQLEAEDDNGAFVSLKLEKIALIRLAVIL